MKSSISAFLLTGFACFAQLTFAQALEGKKTITLSDGASERIVIGSAVFTSAADGKTQFKIELDPDKFQEYFLAMRPFKCVTGTRQHMCHFPLTRVGETFSGDDLVPLEYALMFMHKKPAMVSLNSRDGLYYQLTRTAKGFSGRIADVDMEPVIVPDSVPVAQRARPIRKADLHVSDPSAYWLPYISIE
jgi:hypothetical protein